MQATAGSLLEARILNPWASNSMACASQKRTTMLAWVHLSFASREPDLCGLFAVHRLAELSSMKQQKRCTEMIFQTNLRHRCSNPPQLQEPSDTFSSTPQPSRDVDSVFGFPAMCKRCEAHRFSHASWERALTPTLPMSAPPRPALLTSPAVRWAMRPETRRILKGIPL